jgi:hypothetical protein
MAESSSPSPANKEPSPTTAGDGSGLCTRDPSLNVSHEADGFRLMGVLLEGRPRGTIIQFRDLAGVLETILAVQSIHRA